MEKVYLEPCGLWFFLQMTEESAKSVKIEPCSHITTKIAIQTNDNLCQNV